MSDAQERAWADLSDTYLIDVPRDVAQMSVHADAQFIPEQAYGRSAPLIVEIGSGQGHAIVHAASGHPETDFLAVEVFRAGLARTMLDADKAGVTNLRLAEANAPEVLAKLLPAASVDEVWVFFPDPWHKVRHNKRRLIQDSFLPLVAGALRDGGVVRMATDWEEYALQMREVFDGGADFERDFTGEWADRFDGRVLTAFERKGERAGRAIHDLSYRRLPRV
nr:tRNA (guanosine(46)-N7)-methyltransferase TrmB [Microbacterium gorillae]